jgi:Tol biopolymer transport system component/DNA-binding winged helix-turn-helix (wHTH) protein
MARADNKKEIPPPVGPALNPSLLVRFGEFTLDLRRRGLYREGKRVHLTSKPFETLVVLVEHHGRTVEKQKLLDVVWKDAFVTEDSLVKAVREIRRALEDEKESPAFVQTVPGEGYRFIAELTPAAETEHRADPEVQKADVASERISTPPARRPRLPSWAVGAVVVLLATLTIVITRQSWRASESTAHRLISSVHAAHTSTSFSPDGNWITYVGDVDGVSQIWVKSLAGGEPVQITSGDVPATHPRWSPKNDEIVFSRGKESQSIWSVPPLGGVAPRLLIEDGHNQSWSWDGNRLVFEVRNEIWTANADGTNRRKVDGVPRLELLISDREPAFSPDGSHIAFFQPQDGPMGDIWVVPSNGGDAKQLTFDNHLGGGLVWTPDGEYIVFASQRGGSKTLWKISQSGGTPQPVLKSSGEDTNPEISRDGAKLIYTNTRNYWVLTSMDPASGRIEELKESRTDLFFPAFSPRADKIAFFATADEGDIHLFTVRPNGKELQQVTRNKGERNTFPTWSADGSILYFYQVRPTLSFRGISAEGGTSFEVAPGWRWRSHNGARVDPSGKRIVYSKLQSGKSVATLVRRIDTGTEQVFKPTLDRPKWSVDGKFVLGLDLSTSGPDDLFGDVLVCSVESGRCRTVATKGAEAMWSGDDSRIYFDRWKSADSRDIWSVSREGGDEKWFAERRQVDPIAASYDVSPTGQVVYVQFKQGQQELWMTDFH